MRQKANRANAKWIKCTNNYTHTHTHTHAYPLITCYLHLVQEYNKKSTKDGMLHSTYFILEHMIDNKVLSYNFNHPLKWACLYEWCVAKCGSTKGYEKEMWHNIKEIQRMMSTTLFVQIWPKCPELPKYYFSIILLRIEQNQMIYMMQCFFNEYVKKEQSISSHQFPNINAWRG